VAKYLPNAPGGRSGLKVLAVGMLDLILLLGLYVGSTGPAIHVLDVETWLAFYGPLTRLTAKWEPADKALTWWLQVWGYRPGRRQQHTVRTLPTRHVGYDPTLYWSP
jgi:hypothetical protein